MQFYLYSNAVECYIWVAVIDDFEMTEESAFLFLIDPIKAFAWSYYTLK